MLYTLGLYAVNVHCYITSNGFFNYLYFQDMGREKCCLFQQFKLVNSCSVNNPPNFRYECLVSKLLTILSISSCSSKKAIVQKVREYNIQGGIQDFPDAAKLPTTVVEVPSYYLSNVLLKTALK